MGVVVVVVVGVLLSTSICFKNPPARVIGVTCTYHKGPVLIGPRSLLGSDSERYSVNTQSRALRAGALYKKFRGSQVGTGKRGPNGQLRGFFWAVGFRRLLKLRRSIG